MNLKAPLSLLLLLTMIHDIRSADSRWKAAVPASVPAVHGSCVVIPCTFTTPPIKISRLRLFRGFWRKGNRIVSTNVPKWKLHAEYKKRTQFLGSLKNRNCTMLLDSVRRTDVGPFYFRVEISEFGRFSFTQQPVSINVIRNPEPPSLSVTRTDKVSASCSVAHACPFQLPKLVWSRPGKIVKRSRKLNAWMWETVSTLTFSPLAADAKKPLNCTVIHRGGKRATKSTLL